MQIQDIQMNKIKLGSNSRVRFNKADLSGLMDSIKSSGLLQPIGVTKKGSTYEVVYGNRRFLAASKLGMSRIPAILIDGEDQIEIDIKNLAENVQRSNVSLLEVGRYCSLLEKQGLNVREIAVRLGTSENFVTSAKKAFNQVPTEFKDKISVRSSGTNTAPKGTIPLTAVNAIESATKSYRLSGEDRKKLYKFALTKDFRPETVNNVAKAIKSGNKNIKAAASKAQSLRTHFMVSNNEYERLWNKHIEDGPFASMTALIRAILEGKVREKVRFI